MSEGEERRVTDGEGKTERVTVRKIGREKWSWDGGVVRKSGRVVLE